MFSYITNDVMPTIHIEIFFIGCITVPRKKENNLIIFLKQYDTITNNLINNHSFILYYPPKETIIFANNIIWGFIKFQ